MASVLNALLMVPVVILMRLLFNEVTLFSSVTQRIANAVSWKSKEWTTPFKQLTDLDFISLTQQTQDEYDHFNDTLDSILLIRYPGSEGHQVVKDFIKNKMSHLGWDVTEDTFKSTTPVGQREFTNVITTLNPSACTRLVFACHYDSKLTPNGFLAATDSAVPCAILIHLATLLDNSLKLHREKVPSQTIQFLFFDGEEAFRYWTQTDSLYGSRHLAQKWNRLPFTKDQQQTSNCPSSTRSDKEIESELDRIEVLVLLDLLGEADPKFYSYHSNTNSLHSKLVTIESKLNELQQVESHPPQTRTNYFLDRQSFAVIEDDHIPFLRRGVPIVHVIPSPFPKVWHKLTDNRDNLHHPTINNLIKIFKVFIVQYLNLDF